MTDTERLLLVAVHEAGHAVCDVLQGFKLLEVTIEPDESNDGACVISPFDLQMLLKQSRRAQARSFCAGYVAEVLLYPSKADHDNTETDFEKAEELLSSLFPGQDITNECWAVYEETAALLGTESNIRAIRLVADELLRHNTIAGSRVTELVSQARAGANGKAGGR